MLTLIIFILIMSFLVLIHELGHFLAAKKMGVKVEEFGLGIPPAFLKKKIGETEYSLNLLPFGGFVKLSGEDALPSTESQDITQDSSNFMSKTPLQRIFILSAGVLMNLLVAFALYYVLFSFNGYRSLNIPVIFDYSFKFGREDSLNTVITSFAPDSAARTSGAELGEAVLEINKVPVYNVNDVKREVGDKSGQEITLLLMDLKKNQKDNLRTITVTPGPDAQGQGILGVYLSKSVVLDYSHKDTRTWAGPMHAYNMIAYSRHVLGQLIQTSLQTKSTAPISEGVAGPVGIYTVVGSILDYGGDRVWMNMLDFVALMSLSLALLNSLPFPALDGGRLIFAFFEMVTRRRVNVRFETFVHKWGMILLLGLIVLITVKDLGRLFG